MKSLYLFLIILVPVLLSAQSEPEVLDRIVAVVGKEPILLSDLKAKVEFYVFNNKIDPKTPGLDQQVLDMMVNEKLIITKALDDTNVTVTEDEISNQLDAVIAQRVQQLGSERRVEELYGMPISRIKREYRDDMRKQILASKFQELKFSKITVSRREVEEFFAEFKDSLPQVPEEVDLYHIVRTPKVGKDSKDRTIELAQSLIDSLRSGEDFGDLARRYSQDPGTARAGGDLPFVRRGEFVKEFEEAAFALKDSQLSSPVETKFGIHIIQMLERRGDAIHVRHILLKTEKDSSSINETLAFLASLADSVRNGRSFFELAKLNSDDPRTSSIGGYLGLFTADQLDRDLTETLSSMKDGDISAPVEISGLAEPSYQIVYLKKRIPEHAMNLTDDWARLEQMATSYKNNNEYRAWIEQLRKDVYWEIRL